MSKSHEISTDHYNRASFFDLSAVTDHLAEGGDINAVASLSRNTFLHIAAQQDNKNMIRLLLERGININAANNEGRTALHEVTSQEAAQLLLAAGANPFIRETTDNLDACNYHARREVGEAMEGGAGGIPISAHIINHMEALANAVIEKSALYHAVGKPFIIEQLIPDLANIAIQYQGYGNPGEITVESLSINPEQAPTPQRREQLLMQQSLLQELFTEAAEEKKAASAATPSPSIPPSPQWRERVAPTRSASAPLPSSSHAR